MDRAMNHELICTWLGLPAEEWPPNHYRLLGLEAGESDTHLIEQRVHQRLDAIRRYQMMHPEAATEAMNRLAQAFVCLTEPTAKRIYDTTVLGLTISQPEPAPEPAVEAVGEPAAPAGLNWVPEATRHSRNGPDTMAIPVLRSPAADTQIILHSDNDTVLPPPVRGPASTPPPPPNPPPVVDETPSVDPDATPPPVRRSPSSRSSPRIDPAVELARSQIARRGLGTRRAFYLRVQHTWRLLHLWDRLGKYFASPKRRLPRSSESGPLLELLEDLDNELESFPPILGEAGQPGFLIVNLTGPDNERPPFHTLDLDQRRSLSRDWQAGRALLIAHRDFLFQEVRQLRRHGLRYWTVRAIRAFVNDRPGLVFLAIALAALGMAVYRTWH
jgi:hypothetical protein